MQPWRVHVLTGEPKERLSAALVRAHAEGAPHGAEYKYYPDELLRAVSGAPPQGRLGPLRPPRHRARRDGAHAGAARAQPRLLRRAGRHDLHHRSPARDRQLARLRHLPRQRHDGGARPRPRHLRPGGLRAVPRDDPARARAWRRRGRGVRPVDRLRGHRRAGKRSSGPSACRRATSRAFAAGREGESDAGAQSRIVGPSGVARRSRLQQFRRPDRPRGDPQGRPQGARPRHHALRHRRRLRRARRLGALPRRSPRRAPQGHRAGDEVRHGHGRCRPDEGRLARLCHEGGRGQPAAPPAPTGSTSTSSTAPTR